ncbi:hypothetical protein [uncultured Ellagibacter sp.]|uniref:hypothetical protein n=1 Tax=uncultured Ellagibacter sp. TaxID=2137580 RepID=UPI00260B9AD8|nr:hypothetical protein [uncultured Ellagibacter sp.]
MICLAEESESDLMREFVEAGRGTGDGPDDEHAVKEVEYADSERRSVLRPAVDRVQPMD